MSSGVNPVIAIAQGLSVFIGITIAEQMAPHLVVFIAAVTGSIIGLMSWRTCKFFEGVGYIALFTIVSWLFAGFATDLMNATVPLKINWPASIAAFSIAAIGHRWAEMPIFVIAIIKRRLGADGKEVSK